MGGRLIKWFLVGVLLAALPIGLHAAWLAATPPALNWGSVFGKGELLGLSLGYTSNSAYDLLFKKRGDSTLKASAVMACYSLGIGAAGLLGLVLALYASDVRVAGGVVASMSVVPYILASLLSAGCAIAIEG